MSNHHTRLITQDDTLFVHTVFDDDAAIKRNTMLRDADLLTRAKLGIHDDADIRFILSVPSVMQWNLWKKAHPEDAKHLFGKDDVLRIRAAHRLSIEHPEWVIQSRA